MKEGDYTGAFLVIGGHVLVPIFALVMIFIMIRSIKRYGGDPYEEMLSAGLFMLSGNFTYMDIYRLSLRHRT